MTISCKMDTLTASARSRQGVTVIWHVSHFFLWQMSRDLHQKIFIADCMRYVQEKNILLIFAKHRAKTQRTLWQHPNTKICQTVFQHVGFSLMFLSFNVFHKTKITHMDTFTASRGKHVFRSLSFDISCWHVESFHPWCWCFPGKLSICFKILVFFFKCFLANIKHYFLLTSWTLLQRQT